MPVLLVATHRPEFQPPWVGQSQVTVIALNRLGRGEGATPLWSVRGTERFADSPLEGDGFELLVPRTAAREPGIFQRTQVDHLWHSDRLPR